MSSVFFDRRSYCGWESLPYPRSAVKETQHDIAVLTMDKPFRFNRFVQPACLPEPGQEIRPGTMLQVSGYGKTEYNGSPPDALHFVSVPKVDQKQCRVAHRSWLAINGTKISADMMCAGYPEGGKGSCQGDSGGPLVQISKRDGGVKSATLIGVVSFGYK